MAQLMRTCLPRGCGLVSCRPRSSVCDRKGPRERVIDESQDPPITGIYPTCSVCGKPQVFPP